MRTHERVAVLLLIVVGLWWLIHQPLYWQFDHVIRTLPEY